jgi:hypothetical protein
MFPVTPAACKHHTCSAGMSYSGLAPTPGINLITWCLKSITHDEECLLLSSCRNHCTTCKLSDGTWAASGNLPRHSHNPAFIMHLTLHCETCCSCRSKGVSQSIPQYKVHCCKRSNRRVCQRQAEVRSICCCSCWRHPQSKWAVDSCNSPRAALDSEGVVSNLQRANWPQKPPSLILLAIAAVTHTAQHYHVIQAAQQSK